MVARIIRTMHAGRQKIVSLLSALSVLVVSVTCSSAGCLLAFPSSSSAPAVKSCCAADLHHSGDNHLPNSPERREPCPLCHTPALLGTSLDHNAHLLDAMVLGPAFFGPVSSAELRLLAVTTVHREWRADSSPGGDTLLNLRCALLN